MRVRTATTPAGDVYDVAVEWLPRWRLLARRIGGWRSKDPSRRRRDGDSWLDRLDLPVVPDVDDLLVGIAVIVGLVVAGLLFWWLLLPLLLVVLDGLVVLALVLVGGLGRVLFRRPWTVVVRRGGAVVARVGVVGWRRALHVRDEIAGDLAAGLSVTAVAARGDATRLDSL